VEQRASRVVAERAGKLDRPRAPAWCWRARDQVVAAVEGDRRELGIEDHEISVGPVADRGRGTEAVVDHGTARGSVAVVLSALVVVASADARGRHDLHELGAGEHDREVAELVGGDVDRQRAVGAWDRGLGHVAGTDDRDRSLDGAPSQPER